MIIRLYFITGLFILLSCKPNNSPKKNEAAVLFKTYCVNCHGIDGSLMTNGAKDLRVSPLTLDERILVISEGRNVMTAFKNTLSDDQIRILANYTIQLTDTMKHAK